jgi:hypothetical protein
MYLNFCMICLLGEIANADAAVVFKRPFWYYCHRLF